MKRDGRLRSCDSTFNPAQWMRVKRGMRYAKPTISAVPSDRNVCELALEAAHLGVWDFNPQTRSVAIDGRVQSIYGTSKQELTYDELIGEIIHSEDAKSVDVAFRRALDPASNGKLRIEHRVPWADGSIHWVSIRGQAYFDAGRTRVIRFVGVVADVEDRSAAERELQTSNRALNSCLAEREALANWRTYQLKLVTAELIRAEQKQKKNLAQILHDQLQPSIVAAKLNVELLKRGLDDDGLRQSAQQIADLLDEGLDTSRLLTSELNPPVLHNGSFADAMRWLGCRMLEKHRLEVVVEADDRINPRDEEIRTLLFQSLKELLFNVVKHAKVSRAFVRLKRGSCSNEFQVVVSDDGSGFDPQRPPKKCSRDGLGLVSIQERLEILGGRSEVVSAPGKGTRVTLVSPLRLAKPCYQ